MTVREPGTPCRQSFEPDEHLCRRTSASRSSGRAPAVAFHVIFETGDAARAADHDLPSTRPASLLPGTSAPFPEPRHRTRSSRLQRPIADQLSSDFRPGSSSSRRTRADSHPHNARSGRGSQAQDRAPPTSGSSTGRSVDWTASRAATTATASRCSIPGRTPRSSQDPSVQAPGSPQVRRPGRLARQGGRREVRSARETRRSTIQRRLQRLAARGGRARAPSGR